MKTKTSISDDIRKEIALRAYYIWEADGRPEGREAAHWAKAEAEILSEPRTNKAPAANPAAAAPKKVTAAPASAKATTAKNPVEKKSAGNGSAKPAKAAADAPVKTTAKVVKKKAAKPKKTSSPDA